MTTTTDATDTVTDRMDAALRTCAAAVSDAETLLQTERDKLARQVFLARLDGAQLTQVATVLDLSRQRVSQLAADGAQLAHPTT